MYLLKYLLILIGCEFLLMALPFLSGNLYVIIYTFAINAYLTWFIIKKIERKYYSKYNDFASQLYNICPLLGVAIIFGGIFYFWRTAAMGMLLIYYLGLFGVVYVINFIYVLDNVYSKKDRGVKK